MRLECSAPFDPDSAADFSLFPAIPAVFALFPHEQPGAGPEPYLSHTRDLRRRLSRLLRVPDHNSKRLNLRVITRRIEYQYAGSGFEAQWFLFQLNRFYYPRRFRRRLRLKPPALIKINLQNRFPRCYPVSRIAADGALYYGPFPSRAAAERFAEAFLDLYKIRRCLPNLNPDPAHPGCIYSQMKMCLAPCFRGCTDEEYQEELRRVIDFLETEGMALVAEIEAERDRASAALEFERAGRAQRRIEKAREAIRFRPPLVKEIYRLHAIIVLPGRERQGVTFFRVVAGRICGPAALSLTENVSSPVPLDRQIQELLDPLKTEGEAHCASGPDPQRARPRLPPWEHLSLLARWYYSSFRTGEILMMTPDQELPHARLVRLCRKVMGAG